MIEIIRQSDDLNRQVWQFDFMDYHRRPLVILEIYQVQVRKTRRHSWTTEAGYRRTDWRNSTLKNNEVPLPDDVAQEALQKFMEGVKVVKELGR